MYKALVRVALRQGMSRLNRGDYALMLTLAHPDFELSFPGRNSWSTMFREPSLGRHRKATHVGISEGRAFADRFVAAGAQMIFVGYQTGLRGPGGVVVPYPNHEDHMHVRFPNPG